jgi:hypothetical protein
LSSRLEYLPLALAQAAAFIQENSITVNEYLQLLDRSDQDLVELLSEEFETVGRDSDTPRAVTATWIVSFEQINQQNGFAAELLSLMSFFDRQAIPSEFLSYYGKQRQSQESSREIHLQKALGVLKAFFFVVVGNDETLDMHRLVQLVTRKWLVKRDMHQFAGQALLSVSNVYPYGDFENRVIGAKYLPHVFAVLKYKGTGSMGERLALAELLHRTASYFGYKGQWKLAEIFQLKAVDVRRKLLGEEHPSTLSSMANLAAIYLNQGRRKEAEELGVQVMEGFKRVQGLDHPNTFASMGYLALTYHSQGRGATGSSGGDE